MPTILWILFGLTVALSMVSTLIKLNTEKSYYNTGKKIGSFVATTVVVGIISWIGFYVFWILFKYLVMLAIAN